ncbi:MAG: hypothetical protein DSY80_09935, partial [Desulfocapsa sp.]
MTTNGMHEHQYPEEQEIHLRDYWLVIVKRKTTVITFLAITFLTVFIATYTATPYYTASSQVLIERNESGGIDGRSYYRWDPEFLTTQFELIRSANVAHNVVKTLKLDTKYKHYFFEPKKEGFSTYLSTLKSSVKEFFSGLFSSSGTEIAEDEGGGLLAIAKEPISDADIIANIIKGNLSIKPVANTKTVHIAYSDKHPAMAKLIANAIVQAYIDEILEIKLANNNYSLQWMTAKANEERKKLEGAELALQRYARKNDLVTVENKLAVYPQRLGEFSSQLSKAQAQ